MHRILLMVGWLSKVKQWRSDNAKSAYPVGKVMACSFHCNVSNAS